MKNWILLVVLLVGLSAAGTVLVQYLPTAGSGEGDLPITAGTPVRARTGAEPKVIVDGELSYDFGTMPQRAVGKRTWTVHNEGKGELELWMISSTCSCTLAKFKDGSKAVVKPGETTTIDLEYETRENNGEYAKGATIGTNDPSLPEFALTVKGKVYPPVMTLPADGVVNLGAVSNDKDLNEGYVALFSRDRPETKVLKISTSNSEVLADHEAMDVAELKSIPPPALKSGERVTVKVKSGIPLGAFREEVVITTDHPKQPEVRLTVIGKMTGPINLIPSALSMHDVYGKAGATGELSVVVMSQRETKFEVVKKPKALQVEILPVEGTTKPGRYRLVVTVPPGTPAMRIEDEIVMKTDHPKAGTIIVPLSIWVVNSN